MNNKPIHHNKIYKHINWSKQFSNFNQACLESINSDTKIKCKTFEQDVPCSALIFSKKTGKILEIANNQRRSTCDLFMHCEINLLKKWVSDNKFIRFSSDIGMYCLLEPCFMCYFALLEARLSLLVYALENPRTNTIKNINNITFPPIKKLKVVYHREKNTVYQNVLKNFFFMLRKEKKLSER